MDLGGLVTGDTPIIGLSAPVILGLFFLAMMRGMIVPRKTLEDVIKDRDSWRAAHELSEKARTESQDQVRELLTNTRHNEAVLQRLADIIVRERSS